MSDWEKEACIGGVLASVAGLIGMALCLYLTT